MSLSIPIEFNQRLTKILFNCVLLYLCTRQDQWNRLSLSKFFLLQIFSTIWAMKKTAVLILHRKKEYLCRFLSLISLEFPSESPNDDDFVIMSTTSLLRRGLCHYPFLRNKLFGKAALDYKINNPYCLKWENGIAGIAQKFFDLSKLEWTTLD